MTTPQQVKLSAPKVGTPLRGVRLSAILLALALFVSASASSSPSSVLSPQSSVPAAQSERSESSDKSEPSSALGNQPSAALALLAAISSPSSVVSAQSESVSPPTSDLRSPTPDLGSQSTVLSPRSSDGPPSSVLGSPSSLSALTAANAALMSVLDDKHFLAIGDRISYRVQEDLDDPTEPLDPKPLIVTDSGEIEVPYVGRVHAETKTCKQLALEIKQLLEKDYYHQATVLISIDLRAKTRGKVYLIGPVRMPGPQEIPSDETLTLGKAIMRAGGFNDFADRRNVKVTRKSPDGDLDKKTFTVDVGAIFDKGKVEQDITLQPGDLILIPERTIRF